MQQFVAARLESSPYPSPDYLAGYERIVPGLGRKVMGWIEEESKFRRREEHEENIHRREIEKSAAEHRIKLENRAMDLSEKAMGWGIFRANVGMFLAWPLVIGIVGWGGYLIHEGHDTAGATLVLGALGTVVGAYLLGVLPNREGKPAATEDTDADDE